MCSSNAFEGIPGEIHSVVFNEISESSFQKSIEKIVEKYFKKMLVNLWRISLKKYVNFFVEIPGQGWQFFLVTTTRKKTNTI